MIVIAFLTFFYLFNFFLFRHACYQCIVKVADKNHKLYIFLNLHVDLNNFNYFFLQYFTLFIRCYEFKPKKKNLEIYEYLGVYVICIHIINIKGLLRYIQAWNVIASLGTVNL